MELLRHQCYLWRKNRYLYLVVSLQKLGSSEYLLCGHPSGSPCTVGCMYFKRISTQADLNGYPIYILRHSNAIKSQRIRERLLPVTCVVVRSVDATYHKSLVVTLVFLLSVEVYAKLIVKTSEKALVRHLSLEERNVHT